MKIAFSTSGSTKEDEIDPRFGRCNNFIVYDEDNGTFETFQNEGSLSSGGAGIKAAQTIIDRGVDVVITGNVGPNAFSAMSAAGIEVHVGASGKISGALDKFRSGAMNSRTDTPTVGSHHGTQ
ncbi:MAG TPA: NifB/NifX family molybdenum-iron cluster-binding protein [Candidatus Methanofastidiosa archaeon]|nr:NifB/NifX family molybdenum-iron cluster-binding protein [Candidatus Methanofastidiosa archaeon]HPR41584.1 NifB/NifX family molybdenum-iron cluster-binding protein [Candidatus Methanofastidiosa archaeon]